jgi:hypothetical protein
VACGEIPAPGEWVDESIPKWLWSCSPSKDKEKSRGRRGTPTPPGSGGRIRCKGARAEAEADKRGRCYVFILAWLGSYDETTAYLYMVTVGTWMDAQRRTNGLKITRLGNPLTTLTIIRLVANIPTVRVLVLYHRHPPTRGTNSHCHRH